MSPTLVAPANTMTAYRVLGSRPVIRNSVAEAVAHRNVGTPAVWYQPTLYWATPSCGAQAMVAVVSLRRLSWTGSGASSSSSVMLTLEGSPRL